MYSKIPKIQGISWQLKATESTGNTSAGWNSPANYGVEAWWLCLSNGVSLRKPSSKKTKILRKESLLFRWNPYKVTHKAIWICTDGLVGNLRLWSVLELVSSISVYRLPKHTRWSSNYKSWDCSESSSIYTFVYVFSSRKEWNRIIPRMELN